MKKVPKIINEVGFDFHWDNKKIWALNIPVEKIDISELEWHFTVPFWNRPDNGYYDLTPDDVLSNPELYRIEMDRIMQADLSHPLDIMFWKNRWLILDGLHRLVKQKQLGVKTLLVRKVPKDFISRIKK